MNHPNASSATSNGRTHASSRCYLLEVDELGFVRVQEEAGAVVAHGVPADGRLRVLELLRDVFDHRLAVHALEGAAHLQSINPVNQIEPLCR